MGFVDRLRTTTRGTPSRNGRPLYCGHAAKIGVVVVAASLGACDDRGGRADDIVLYEHVNENTPAEFASGLVASHQHIVTLLAEGQPLGDFVSSKFAVRDGGHVDPAAGARPDGAQGSPFSRMLTDLGVLIPLDTIQTRLLDESMPDEFRTYALGDARTLVVALALGVPLHVTDWHYRGQQWEAEALTLWPGAVWISWLEEHQRREQTAGPR
jgi:hypothetical protein